MPIDYDQAAEIYAHNRRIHPGVFQGLLRDLTSTSRVLEVGCGTGNYIISLQEASDCVGWGVDPSEEMLAQALARRSRVAFGRGRTEALPFSERSFDLVFNVDVIHHVAGRAEAYREAYRVLAPGGWVCTVTDSEEIIRRREEEVEWEQQLSTLQGYREKAYSSLHLISDESFRRGMARLEADFAGGPVRGLSRYVLLWGWKES